MTKCLQLLSQLEGFIKYNTKRTQVYHELLPFVDRNLVDVCCCFIHCNHVYVCQPCFLLTGE